MCADQMHADQAHTDVALVRRLLAAQFPRWADLPVAPVPSDGTENAIYRLGDDMAVRLPLRPSGPAQVEKLHRWLPRLAPRLPLAIPVPLGQGEPGEGYPWPWSVCRWLDGENVTPESLTDLDRAARDLAAFIAALQAIDPAGGPAPGAHNFHRGVPLATRDGFVRDALAQLEGEIDTAAAAAAWEAALRAPAWAGPPVWIHGDLKTDNLLVTDGRLSGVIDFGGLGVGDPACEVIVAWDLFSGESRAVFRDAVSVDDATWARGRGWALSIALMALPYYRDTNPGMMAYARRLLAEVLADADG